MARSGQSVYPHTGSGHLKAKAIDTRYFYKDPVLRDRFDGSDGANKIAAATQLSNYIVDLDYLDKFCADKQSSPSPSPSSTDPMGECQDSYGQRRFNGKECFMNREKILAAQSLPLPPPESYWTWDSANLSPLPKSSEPAKACPNSANYTYNGAFNAIDDYTTYVFEMQSGLTRFNALINSNFRILFTFGGFSQLTDGRAHLNWNKLSTIDGTFPIQLLPAINISYPIYKESLPAKTVPLNTQRLGDELDHLNHLHLEAK